jgi:SsrA-binding protein
MSPLIHNRKAGFNYEILEKFEAGLELTGKEVKSVRAGQGSLEGSYISIKRTGAQARPEAWIHHLFIPPYQINNVAKTGEPEDPMRDRKVLLTGEELSRLADLEAGLTVVPISVYNNKRWIKLEVAIVRGKKKFDKRETLKKRDTERAIRREYSDR